MTERQAKAKVLSIKAEAAAAAERIRVAESVRCGNPFCVNRRRHLAGSGKCKIKVPKPT